ncbi:MAG: carboxypeptidase-like regulatory domain-containing protein, partial [Ignavibacteriaceae bacterium]
MRNAVFIYLILFIIPLNAQNTFNVFGRVTDSLTSQSLQNANIIIEPIGKGTTTDKEGYYSINIPE